MPPAHNRCSGSRFNPGCWIKRASPASSRASPKLTTKPRMMRTWTNAWAIGDGTRCAGALAQRPAPAGDFPFAAGFLHGESPKAVLRLLLAVLLEGVDGWYHGVAMIA